MPKWADYAIYAARFNNSHTHIDRVRAFPDTGESFGASVDIARTEVVNKIGNGTTFVTVLKNQDGNYRRGSDVFVVTIAGTKYIKTVRDNTTADNLDNLPEF